MNSTTCNALIWLTIIVSACGTKRSTNVDTKINDFVLVNASGERCEVAEMISLISRDKPRAIGVNFIYVKGKSNACDSILVRAIDESEKVILVEGFENEEHNQSDIKFLNPAMLSGLAGLYQNDNGVVDSYYRVIDHRGRWEYSFPFHLALQYDVTRDSELAGKSVPKDYPITFYHTLNEFKLVSGLDEIKENEGIFKDKIVLIGAMGQAEDDILPTPATDKSTDKTFGTLIMANIILDILMDLDSDVPVNKYTEFIHAQQKAKNRK